MIHRTLLLTAMFPPSIGGAERYLETLGRNLPADRLIIVAPPAVGDDTFDQTFPTKIIRRDLHAGWLRPAWISHLMWLTQLIRKERITRIVFGHYAGFVGLGPLVKVLTGRPYVVSVFGLDFMAYRKTFVRRALLRWTLHTAEWVTTISAFTRQMLCDFGVPDAKIVLAPPGISPAVTVSPDACRAFRQAHGLENRRVLLTVGRIVKRKGHIRVLRAVAEISSHIPELTYVIVGDGPHRPSLEQLCQELKITDKVRFLGKISEADLTTAYSVADAFIMLPQTTPNDAEGFGIVYTEALRLGVPVIATHSGGVSDIVHDNQNGLLLDERATTSDINQAITKLMTDTGLRHKLGEYGKQTVSTEFSIEKQVTPFKVFLSEPSQPNELPLVSVIIPGYNSADTIARTLHSVTTQTHQNLEIIVVDDGSTDETVKLASAFPNVRCIQQDHAGAPVARNSGLLSATGEFVLFCDSDVTLHPRMIERMLTTLKLKPAASYAYCSFRFGWRTFDLFDFDPDRLRKSNYISMMSLIRKSDCPQFDVTLKRLQDWDLWLTMLESGKVGIWVPARLFSASIGKRGISQRIQAPPTEAIRIIREKHRLVA